MTSMYHLNFRPYAPYPLRLIRHPICFVRVPLTPYDVHASPKLFVRVPLTPYDVHASPFLVVSPLHRETSMRHPIFWSF